MSLSDEMIQLLDEAQKGMKRGVIYNTDNMQLIWSQYAKDCNSILISKDQGLTWTLPPYVDSGKWNYSGWLFKIA
jgi:hypothetical protein